MLIVLSFFLPAEIALAEKNNEILMAMVGDILLDGSVGAQIEKFCVDYPC
jgi:hypothetical protein